MSWVLVLQPDSAQADTLRKALRGHIKEEIVVAESIDDALSAIEQSVPDVILLPILASAMEDYLTAYLGAMPGTRHVQILGLPRLERDLSKERGRSLFSWRRKKQEPRAIDAPVCDPGVYTQTVVAYVAEAKAMKEEIRRYGAPVESAEDANRRRAHRFGNDEVSWIAAARIGRDRAALINVSSSGALLRTTRRPDPQFLRRTDPLARRRPRVTFELQWDREVQATGRVIRCIPLKTSNQTHYEIAFSFDDAVGLHLPVIDALVPTHSGPDEDGWVIHI